MENNLDINYALAIFSLLKDNNQLKDSYNEVINLKGIFDDADLIKYLGSYFLDNETKFKFIDKILKNYNLILINGIKLITKHHRINFINEILSSLISLMNEEFNILEGIVYSTIPFTKLEINKLERSLSKKYNREVNLVNKLDPSLIGGFKLLIGKDLYDYSFANNLSQMKNSLLR